MKTTKATRQEPVQVRAEEYFEPSFSKCYDHVMDQYGYRLGFRDFCIYQTLRRFATREGKQKGKCTVLHSTIGKIWGAHPDTVRRAIRRLRAFGMVRCFKKQGASEYFLPIIPVRRSKSRPGKNARSDQANLPYETVQGCTTYQRFYTRGSLPRGASPAQPSSNGHQGGPHDVPRGGSRLTSAERDAWDLRRWRQEMDKLESGGPASGNSEYWETHGLSEQEKKLRFADRAKTAAYYAGVPLKRIRDLLTDSQVDWEASAITLLIEKGKKS